MADYILHLSANVTKRDRKEATCVLTLYMQRLSPAGEVLLEQVRSRVLQTSPTIA